MASTTDFDKLAECISLAPVFEPVVYLPPIPLTRQIGECKWQHAAAVLLQSPDKQMTPVAEHYSGWRYVLVRSEEKNILIRRIYNDSKLIEELRWNIETEISPGFPRTIPK